MRSCPTRAWTRTTSTTLSTTPVLRQTDSPHQRHGELWTLLKRALKGTYVSVEPFHLFRYLDEQTFRFNNRSWNDAERFSEVVSAVVGRRLTYDELIGKPTSAESQPS